MGNICCCFSYKKEAENELLLAEESELNYSDDYRKIVEETSK